MKKTLSLISIGILSGIAVGYFLKIIEALTGEKVYTLLLNVDYVPILRTLSMNEFMEFMLHIIVSILLVIVFYFMLRRFHLNNKSFMYILLNVLVGMLLWGTTVLSTRTPDLMDGTALFYWLVGHLLYGSIVGFMIKLVED